MFLPGMAQLPHTVPAMPLKSDYPIWRFEKTVTVL